MTTPTAQDFARAVAAELLSDPVVQSQAAVIVGHGQVQPGAGYGFAPQPQYGFAPAPPAAAPVAPTKTVVVYGTAPPPVVIKKGSKLQSALWALVGFVAGVSGPAWLVDRNADCP